MYKIKIHAKKNFKIIIRAQNSRLITTKYFPHDYKKVIFEKHDFFYFSPSQIKKKAKPKICKKEAVSTLKFRVKLNNLQKTNFNSSKLSF